MIDVTHRIHHRYAYFNRQQINFVIKRYQASHVGTMCLKGRHGQWLDFTVEIFYVDKPDKSKNHSNYLAVFYQDGRLMLTNGISAVSEEINAVMSEDGDIIYSSYRYDMAYAPDKITWIDGGRDYTRSSISPALKLKIKDGKWFTVGKETT